LREVRKKFEDRFVAHLNLSLQATLRLTQLAKCRETADLAKK
jgi:hypothetical protein